MPGRNCAFFGYPTSQKHKLSLFQIPVVSAKQSEYTAAIKKKSREEWLKIILILENKGDDSRIENADPQLQQYICL